MDKRPMSKEQSNVPKKPGLYYYRMNGGGVWRHQEVLWHKQGVLVVLVMNNGEGFLPVSRLHRHWLSAGEVPGGRTIRRKNVH